MKRIRNLMALVMILTGLFILMPFASVYAFDCANAKVVKIGVYPGDGTADGFFIQLDDLSDAGWVGVRSFYLSPQLGKTGLAVVLTALSMEKTMWVRLVDTTPGSLATIVYINEE
jgi:hypothetical protein